MNNSMLSRFNQAVTPNDNRKSVADPFREFADLELTTLVSAAITALQARGLPFLPQFTQPRPSHTTPTPQIFSTPAPSKALSALPAPRVKERPSDMWDNAKVEQIICPGLKPLYDGSPEKLTPTMNLIIIRRRNEVWFPATFIVQDVAQIDLVMKFSQVKETTVLAQAKRLWSAPDANIQSHTRGTATYNNRLLGVFLMNSLTPEFAALLHARIDPGIALTVHCCCMCYVNISTTIILRSLKALKTKYVRQHYKTIQIMFLTISDF
jgi:hypothetical protein